MLSNNEKWSEDLTNGQKILINPQKIFLKSHVDLRKIFIEDLLKISERTLNEIFLISRARTVPYLFCG